MTVFYALAYMSVYTSEHPAVRGSEWIRENIPRNSVILKEHWEEGLPGLHGYRILELPMYNDDRPYKINQISDLLARADVLTLYSNRLYGTVPRLEDRYPVSREYYRLLFEGHLGYQLEAHFTSYPSLFGVALVDDTFRRPRLPTPAGIASADLYAAEIELGYADESFTVYDHPKVLIFRNVSRMDAGAISDLILSAAEGFPENRPIPPSAEHPTEGRRLMLTPSQLEAQRAGGTWSDIVDSDGWPGRMPVVGMVDSRPGHRDSGLPTVVRRVPTARRQGMASFQGSRAAACWAGDVAAGEYGGRGFQQIGSLVGNARAFRGQRLDARSPQRADSPLPQGPLENGGRCRDGVPCRVPGIRAHQNGQPRPVASIPRR